MRETRPLAAASASLLLAEMRTRSALCLCSLLLALSLLSEKAEAAPRPEAMWKCEGLACFPKAAPICAVDASGEMRSFINECFMELAYCREMKYYVKIKNGEC